MKKRQMRLFAIVVISAVGLYIITTAFFVVRGEMADSDMIRAVRSRDVSALRRALDGGANPNIVCTLEEPEPASFRDLLKQIWNRARHPHPRLPNMEYRKPILFWCVQNGTRVPLTWSNDSKLVSALTEHSANVNIVDAKGQTPLYYAVQLPSIGAIDALLRYHADPNLGRAKPIFRAEREVARLLLQHGADPNPAPFNDENDQNSGYSPLQIALLNRADDAPDMIAARALLEYGADPNVGSDSDPLVMEMAWGGHPDAIEMLLKHGARRSDLQLGRTTALHVACMTQRGASTKTIRYLLQLGFRVTARDRNGCTPLDYARRIEPDNVSIRKEMIGLLEAVARKERQMSPAMLHLRQGSAPERMADRYLGSDVSGHAMAKRIHLPNVVPPKWMRVLGLQFGISTEYDVDRRVGVGTVHIGGHSNSGRSWGLQSGLELDADGFDGGRGPEPAYILDRLWFGGWHGELGMVKELRPFGMGVWSKVKRGMSRADCLRLVPPEMRCPAESVDELSWYQTVYAARFDCPGRFRYSATLQFESDRLKSLELSSDFSKY